MCRYHAHVLALLLLVTGCRHDGSPADPSPPDTALSACSIIDGATYRSVDMLECGLGPEGPVLCNWTIRFAASEYDWSYSDIATTGTYTCDGTSIQGTNPGGGTPYIGTLDVATGLLTWAGVVYERAP